MDKVRIGIIGMGNMGCGHAKYLCAGEIPGAALTAVADVKPDRLQWSRENLKPADGGEVKTFPDAKAIMGSGLIDAVIVATPHYDHPPLAIDAFRAGLHVMIEKPAGVYTKQVREMNEAAKASGKVFSIMYQRRATPLWSKMKDFMDSGELGELKRTNWIITSWYRPQSYFDSGSWRATWDGEGGGVLLNQDPHQLDLWQWTCGMPSRVRAFCYYGKYHDIEVEDDVTAYVEYPDGATGIFVTGTGEAPGTDRLEISGNRGKVVVEDGKITFWRLRTGEREFNATWKGGFGSPECWKCEVPVEGTDKQHAAITRNWVDSILHGTKLIAPGEEGIRGLTLSNAMHLSSWTNDWVSLPLDEDLFHKKLQEKIRTAKRKGK